MVAPPLLSVAAAVDALSLLPDLRLFLDVLKVSFGFCVWSFGSYTASFRLYLLLH